MYALVHGCNERQFSSNRVKIMFQFTDVSRLTDSVVSCFNLAWYQIKQIFITHIGDECFVVNLRYGWPHELFLNLLHPLECLQPVYLILQRFCQEKKGKYYSATSLLVVLSWHSLKPFFYLFCGYVCVLRKQSVFSEWLHPTMHAINQRTRFQLRFPWNSDPKLHSGMGCTHALLTEKSRASKQSTCNACFLLVEETTFSILASSFSLSVCTRVYFLIFFRSRGRRVQCCMGAMSKSESLSLLHRWSCSHRYKQY